MSILHKNDTRRKVPVKGILGIAVVLAVIAVMAAASRFDFFTADSEKQKTVSSSVSLEQIIKESKISTFTAVYNGIAEIPDEKNPDQISYYVRYEARVNAGFDLDQLTLETVDKTVRVKIPPITLDKPNVDITSFDRMNVTKKDHLSELNGNEYRLCEEDAKNEAEKKEVIKDLARENAKNVIRSLLEPFLDEEQTIEFVEDDAS